ncbi:MAG: 2-hydroxychromene-2-carboxylate isomerase [Mariprofundus sp.]
MNKPVIDFYFDFISPYSYLATTRMDAFCQQFDADFRWIPVNLPKLIKWSGNTPPTLIKNKAIYSLRDLKRWAKYLDVPFSMIMPGSFDSRPAMRIALALNHVDRIRFCHAVFDSLWSGAISPRQPGWLQQVIALNQLPEKWLSEQEDRLDEMTQQALDAGAFGAPTFILHKNRGRDEMFFGLDHMDFLRRACEAVKTAD